jgi:hypothetical protein
MVASIFDREPQIWATPIVTINLHLTVAKRLINLFYFVLPENRLAANHLGSSA